MKNRKPQKPGSRPAPPRGKRPPRKHGERDARPESRADDRSAKPFRRREDGPRNGPGPGRPGLPKEDRAAAEAKPEQTRGRRQQRVEKSAEARAEKPYGKPHGARADKRPKSRADSRNESRAGAPQLWVYGRHAVVAALKNPDRPIKRVLATPSGAEFLRDQRVPQERLVNAASSTLEAIDAVLHEGAVHQGLAAMVGDIPRARLKETCAPDGTNRPVLVLDQITDPQNIGAIFRSAAAFRARAIIVQDRRTPPLAGALAKAAAGAVELVPCVDVVNVARALEALKGLGYFCAGLSGDGTADIGDIPSDQPIALVLGAEGAGLRQLVASTCDGLFRIPIARAIESLNVSTAAAVSLYAITNRRG